MENATDARAQEAGETTATGYTMMIRRTAADAFARAGYTMVVDPKDAHDLRVSIHSEPVPGKGPFGGLLASLTVRGEGGVVEQLSGRVDIDENVDIDARQVIALIEKVGTSPSVARFVASLPPRAAVDARSAGGADLTAGLGSAKTAEELQAALPLSRDWQRHDHRGMQILTGVSDLGTSGESYLDVHGYVYNRHFAEWRRFCMVKTRSVGQIHVGIDEAMGVLFVEGRAQNHLRGKRVVLIDLATVSDDALQVAR
ncbi:Hypothetical protein A7982_02097 [Minicystis rosea]|nr:Hypothetical protein A7982_02097 [Minicystis rosea]